MYHEHGMKKLQNFLYLVVRRDMSRLKSIYEEQ